MTTLSMALSDSNTMLRRNLQHAIRYPSIALGTVIMPAMLLLLFVFGFGGAIGKGLTGDTSTTNYANYVSPGVFLLAVASAAMSTSIAVAVDMTKGIVNRFRTMAISRSSVLIGHVIGSVIQAMVSVLLVVIVALLAGFRPTTNPIRLAASLGLVALVSLALTWIAVALGLMAKTVDTASNTPMILQLFPFLSSAFVPADTMAPGLRWFAQHQPFTPINETLRALLNDTPVGNIWIIAIGWCLAITLAGYLWSKALYKRDPRAT